MLDFKKDFSFSLSKTKVLNSDKEFDLSDPKQREEYFELKVGNEIRTLKKYFENNTFIVYWLGKKSSGKGTYSKLMIEIFGKDKIEHISIGDITRKVFNEITSDKNKKEELEVYLRKNYRGYISVTEALDRFINKTQDKLLPTEFILALAKREIGRKSKKTLFIDGFPRNLDQISYALYFRDLIDYREDDDIFVGIDIPETVIEERMKSRVICPRCNTPRSIKFFPTNKIEYDKEKKNFYLVCDNPECNNLRMISKDGDSDGISSIKERMKLDGSLIEKIFVLHGIPKILLRNSLPVNIAKDFVETYEITPEYSYKLDQKEEVITEKKPWIFKNDEKEDSISLQAPPVVISLIKQLAKILIK